MEEIKKVVRNYIEEENTDYAIMICGEWGCGKSYFVHNELKAFIETFPYAEKETDESKRTIRNLFRKKKENDPCYKPVYASLYGVSSIEDFNSRIFDAVNPSLSRYGGLASWALSQASSLIGVEADRKELKHFISHLSHVTNQNVLILDDFERISFDKITAKEILGLVNNYTENKYVKVILVCNEDEIHDEQYTAYKEKSVRFTYHYEAEISTVYDALVSKKGETIRDYYFKFKELIMYLFDLGGNKNIRTLKFFIDAIPYLCKLIPNEFRGHDWITRRLTIALLIYSMEYKRGDSKIEDIQGLKNKYEIDFGLWGNNIDNVDKDKEPSYEDKVWTRYGQKYRQEMGHYPFLVDYISNGFLDEKILNDVIQELEEFYEKNEEKPWSKVYKELSDIPNLDDSKAEELLNDLLGYVRNNKYNLYQLLNVYALLLRYCHFQICNLYLSPEIENDFLMAMDAVSPNHQFDQLFSYHTPIWDNSDPNSKEYVMYNKMKSHAVEINEQKGKQVQEQLVNTFLNIAAFGDISELRKYRENPNKRMSLDGMDWNKVMDILVKGSNPVACELCQCLVFLLPDKSVIHKEYLRDFEDHFVHALDEYVKYKDFRPRNMYILWLWKHVKSLH